MEAAGTSCEGVMRNAFFVGLKHHVRGSSLKGGQGVAPGPEATRALLLLTLTDEVLERN